MLWTHNKRSDVYTLLQRILQGKLRGKSNMGEQVLKVRMMVFDLRQKIETTTVVYRVVVTSPLQVSCAGKLSLGFRSNLI